MKSILITEVKRYQADPRPKLSHQCSLMPCDIAWAREIRLHTFILINTERTVKNDGYIYPTDQYYM